MFLYDKKESSIDVYSVTPGNAMTKYRKEEMVKIPEPFQIMKAHTRIDSFKQTPLFEKREAFDKILPIERVENSNLRYGYHHLLSDYENYDLVNNYINGEYDDKPIVRVQGGEISFYLLTQQKYSYNPNSKYKRTMRGIIQIPESLYLLQLFCQEKFSCLRDESISELLPLFSVSYTDEISLDELEKMDKCGIVTNACQNVLNKANEDAQVLKFIRKG